MYIRLQHTLIYTSPAPGMIDSYPQCLFASKFEGACPPTLSDLHSTSAHVGNHVACNIAPSPYQLDFRLDTGRRFACAFSDKPSLCQFALIYLCSTGSIPFWRGAKQKTDLKFKTALKQLQTLQEEPRTLTYSFHSSWWDRVRTVREQRAHAGGARDACLGCCGRCCAVLGAAVRCGAVRGGAVRSKRAQGCAIA